MLSDNTQVFKSDANWTRNIRNNEKLQDFLAKQKITWKFNLAKSRGGGSMYEKFIKDNNKNVYNIREDTSYL